MRIADHLSDKQKRQLSKMKSPKKKPRAKPKPKKKENLSFRDWEEIMGKHMDIYERRRGAVRRK